jgi:hypothetical protein
MAKKTKTTNVNTSESVPTPATDASPKAKTAKATKSKTPAKTKLAKHKRLSALDAAAKVLGETGEPMTSREMIETMSKKGYWSSPNGQTPEATLYAAMIREISKKGKTSRFAKVERGKFARSKAH